MSFFCLFNGKCEETVNIADHFLKKSHQNCLVRAALPLVLILEIELSHKTLQIRLQIRPWCLGLHTDRIGLADSENLTVALGIRDCIDYQTCKANGGGPRLFCSQTAKAAMQNSISK